MRRDSFIFVCVSGSAAKEFFTKSKLPILELSHIWWVLSAFIWSFYLRLNIRPKLPIIFLLKLHHSETVWCVFEGSCQTSIKMERWPWTSSAPPFTWSWPERTATTSRRSCRRASCRSWSTWTIQQVRRLSLWVILCQITSDSDENRRVCQLSSHITGSQVLGQPDQWLQKYGPAKCSVFCK